MIDQVTFNKETITNDHKSEDSEAQAEPQLQMHVHGPLSEEEALSCCDPEVLAHLQQRSMTVERRPGRGRCVVATRALPAGAEVMSVVAVTAVLRPSHQGRRCNCCLKKADTKLLRCSSCRSAFYCSPTCQKLEWPSHKRECGCLSAATERGLEGDALGDALLLGRLPTSRHQDARSGMPACAGRAASLASVHDATSTRHHRCHVRGRGGEPACSHLLRVA